MILIKIIPVFVLTIAFGSDMPCGSGKDECNGHGFFYDMDPSNGCECTCFDGWSGQYCDVRNGIASDDPTHVETNIPSSFPSKSPTVEPTAGTPGPATAPSRGPAPAPSERSASGAPTGARPETGELQESSEAPGGIPGGDCPSGEIIQGTEVSHEFIAHGHITTILCPPGWLGNIQLLCENSTIFVKYGTCVLDLFGNSFPTSSTSAAPATVVGETHVYLASAQHLFIAAIVFCGLALLAFFCLWWRCRDPGEPAEEPPKLEVIHMREPKQWRNEQEPKQWKGDNPKVNQWVEEVGRKSKVASIPEERVVIPNGEELLIPMDVINVHSERSESRSRPVASLSTGSAGLNSGRGRRLTQDHSSPVPANASSPMGEMLGPDEEDSSEVGLYVYGFPVGGSTSLHPDGESASRSQEGGSSRCSISEEGSTTRQRLSASVSASASRGDSQRRLNPPRTYDHHTPSKSPESLRFSGRRLVVPRLKPRFKRSRRSIDSLHAPHPPPFHLKQKQSRRQVRYANHSKPRHIRRVVARSAVSD